MKALRCRTFSIPLSQSILLALSATSPPHESESFLFLRIPRSPLSSLNAELFAVRKILHSTCFCAISVRIMCTLYVSFSPCLSPYLFVLASLSLAERWNVFSISFVLCLQLSLVGKPQHALCFLSVHRRHVRRESGFFSSRANCMLRHNENQKRSVSQSHSIRTVPFVRLNGVAI